MAGERNSVKKQLQLIAVIGSNSNGEPDVMWVLVKATQEDIDNGDDTRAAIEHALDRGFEHAFVAAYEGCPLWETLIKPARNIVMEMKPIEVA